MKTNIKDSKKMETINKAKSLESKARKEKRVFSMIYQTYKNGLRIDEGMCVMIDDLLEGDLLRLEEIVEQVVLCLGRERKVKRFSKARVKC